MTESELQEYEKFRKPERQEVVQRPPSDSYSYTSFPSRSFETETSWYRNHGALGAWYFDCSNGGRFNLSSPDGTLYLAETLDGAFREWVGPAVDTDTYSRGIHDSVLRDRWVSHLILPLAVKAADIAGNEALWRGILPRLWSAPPYDIPQKYARRFYKSGFGGIYSPLQYTPEHRGVAVFGKEGKRPWAEDANRLPMSEVARKLGVRVWTAPKMREMKMI